MGGVLGAVYINTLPLNEAATNCGLLYSSAMLAADVLITVMMFRGLLRSKSGWADTDRLIGRLMKLMLETQAPATLGYVTMASHSPQAERLQSKADAQRADLPCRVRHLS